MIVPDRQTERVGRVVHHDVDATELGVRGLDERGELVDPAAVRGHRERGATARPDRGGRRLARVGLPARDHDRGAARGVGLGDGAADAATPAGDDRDATVEVELVPDLARVCASVQSRRSAVRSS